LVGNVPAAVLSLLFREHFAITVQYLSPSGRDSWCDVLR